MLNIKLKQIIEKKLKIKPVKYNSPGSGLLPQTNPVKELLQHKRYFKYEAVWVKQKGYKEVIKQVWKGKVREEEPCGALKMKINKSQHAFYQWRKVNYD